MNNTMASNENTDTSHKIHVLLVEDDLIVQRAHYTMLIKLGCTVDVAADGHRAVDMYKKGYSAILMDCGLPGLSGIDASRSIRQIEKKNGLEPTPIVMISAYSKNELENECKSAGINELATKPIRPQELKTILQKYTNDKLLAD